MNTENTAAVVGTEVKARGGRAPTFANDGKLLANLIALRDGTEDAPSRTLSLQLVEMGLVSIVKEKTSEGKGAPKHNFVLSDEGVSRIALLERSEARSGVTEAEAAVAAAEAGLEAANESVKVARAAVTEAKANLKAAVKAETKANAEPKAPKAAPAPEAEVEPETVAEVEPTETAEPEAETVAEEVATETAEA